MLVNKCVPSLAVETGPRDPGYIIPVAKVLSDKRRKLRVALRNCRQD